MSKTYTDSCLEGYLHEQLPHATMVELEQALRSSTELRDRLAEIITRHDLGSHTIGSLWRQERLSCPERTELQNYLLGILDEDVEDWVRFHVETLGCRYCAASLEDLQSTAARDAKESETRRQRYFETSVGRLSQSK
ncbi:hypothetical protein [Calycomorphotria hydatis]|uniref:Uncharacterized protein n=1 Tax=Calycomorphotria hydatis TaxID=2528027 RepID=A0A517TDK4_9PLAN|nr:hypothetical protein [Calycomorphotria hydatis]QDT66456.1 hypothetical protein V22_37230 [Calycomorphotria hydatis]